MGEDYVCRLLGQKSGTESISPLWFSGSSKIGILDECTIQAQDYEMPDVVGCMPRHEVDHNFKGVDPKGDWCGHKALLARRVCSEGVDTGRRYLSCQFEVRRNCRLCDLYIM